MTMTLILTGIFLALAVLFGRNKLVEAYQKSDRVRLVFCMITIPMLVLGFVMAMHGPRVLLETWMAADYVSGAMMFVVAWGVWYFFARKNAPLMTRLVHI